MRRVFALVAGLAMLSGLGCHHNTCDDCANDLCTGCRGGLYAAPGGYHTPPPPKAEPIKALPAPKGGEEGNEE